MRDPNDVVWVLGLVAVVIAVIVSEELEHAWLTLWRRWRFWQSLQLALFAAGIGWWLWTQHPFGLVASAVAVGAWLIDAWTPADD